MLFDSFFFFFTAVGDAQRGWIPLEYPPKQLDFRLLADLCHQETKHIAPP